jgi:hypothetical protein
MGWGEKLRGLLGGKPPPRRKAAPSKAYNAPTDRATIIAEAMAVHRRERAKVQGVLAQAFAALKANPPKPSDVAGMTRFLELRQAMLAMNRVADHDQQRRNVLAGVKTLMESPEAASKDTNAVKPGRRAGPSPSVRR